MSYLADSAIIIYFLPLSKWIESCNSEPSELSEKIFK